MTFEDIQEAKDYLQQTKELLEQAAEEQREQLEWDYMKHTDIRI